LKWNERLLFRVHLQNLLDHIVKARVLSSQVFAIHGASHVPPFAPDNARGRRIDPKRDVA
jgi:hypothetical protein